MAARWAAYLARWREHLHGVQPPIRRPSGTSVSVWSADDSASPMTPGLATDSRPEAAARLGGGRGVYDGRRRLISYRLRRYHTESAVRGGVGLGIRHRAIAAVPELLRRGA